MTLSNNAIKFLQAQYRAIFKRAYIKGLATAVLLTAGLAAGQAQAVDLSTDKNNPTTDLIIASGMTQEFGGSAQYATSFTVNAGGTLESADTVNHDFHFRDSMDVYGTVNVASGHGIVGTFDDEGSGEGSYNQTGDFTGTLNIHSGANFSVANSYVQVKDVNIDGGTITVSGTIGTGQNVADNAILMALGDATGYGTFTLSSGDLTVGDKGQIGGHTTNINGGTVTLAGNADYGAFIRAASNAGEGIFINDGTVEVEANKYGDILGNSITMTGGTISVAASGTLTLAGDFENANVQASSVQHDSTAIAVTAGSITNAGTLTIGKNSADTFTATGGTIKNTGTVDFKGSDLNITSSIASGLFAADTSVLQLSNGANVVVTGDDVLDLSAKKIADSTADGNNLVASGNNTWTQDNVKLGSVFNSANLAFDVKNLTAETAPYQATSKGNNAFVIEQGEISVSDSVELVNSSSALTTEGVQYRIYVLASGDGTTAILNLSNDGSTTGQLKNVDRVYVGYDMSGSSTLNVDGNWDFGGARLAVNTNGEANLNGTVTNVSVLALNKAGELNIGANADVTAQRLLGSENDVTSAAINVDGKLTFTGDSNTDQGQKDYNNDITLTKATININNGGTLAITTEDALDDFISVTSGDYGITVKVEASGDKTTDIGGWSGSKVNLKAGGTLQLNLAELGIKSLTSTQLTALKGDLVSKSSSGGSFDFGEGFTVYLSDNKELQTAIDNGEVSYSELASAGVNDVKGVADNAVVTVDSTTASGAAGINLSTGKAVELEGTNTVNVNSLVLTNTTGDNFVYTTTNGNEVAANVAVTANGAVNLTGNGTVGSLTKASGATGTSAVLTAGQGATQTVQGEIDLGEVTIGAGTVDVTESVTADELNVNGTLNVADGSGDVTITTTSGATIAGTLNAGAITSSGDMDVTGTISAKSITLANGKSLSVGDSSNSGLVEVETLTLDDGMLLIDPDWTQNASFVAVTGANTADVINVGGSIGVGRNSVGVFGTNNADAQEALNRLGLLQAGKLDEQGIGAALYLGETLQIDNQKHVLVDKTLDNNGLSTEIGKLNTSGSVTLNEGSALVISESFSNELVDDQSKAIFEFAATAGTVTVSAESGAEIIFDSADILGNDTVKVATAGGSVNPDISGLSNAEITAAGGLLEGQVDDTYDTITFSLASGAAAHLYNQSNPIRDMTLDVVGNANNDYDSADAGVYYIGAMNAHNGGADIERTARMALYGGAVQATLMAQQTSTDAISERLGMANPNSALIASNNAQGGGLWLSPVYKNHDSDEFEAEGVNYGADIDLYGLALGADFTTESGVRVGAMFNVGSGDAEGQGIGEGVSNDFDYYGFSLYAGVTFGNFALTADAGFTQVSNDLEQAVNYHGVGTLKADTDTQTVSVGVRGEYLFATPWVDVVPHVGVRYTSFDMDSYQAQVDGYTIASADTDSMQVFSIPFGVTFSKEMAMGNWVVKPVFDLNLTANAGDDELESDVAFVGVSNVALTTEVMDSFTYGTTLGVSAQYQESFSFGLNVGYTGSSSADEFGVNANARYTL